MDKPLILEIKCNSLDDGPGIRSVIFFKGCPLSCVWCHNPESKRVNVEISHDKSECIGCFNCVKTCPENALSVANEYFIDRSKCSLCFKCTDICPAKAITRVGIEADEDAILKKVLSDKPFYDVSGGGVTLSGGEATLCTEWVGNLAKKIHENGVRILLETCGFFNYEKAEQFLLPYVNDIFCDIKIFNREEHKKYCGVYNDLILENIRKMKSDEARLGYTFMPRVPLIPDITDTDSNLESIAEFMSEIGVTKTDLLPYNPTWYSKNDKLGIKKSSALDGIDGWQSAEKIEHCKSFFKNKKIEC